MHGKSGQLWLRTADLHWRRVDGEVIALDERRSSYLAANSAGAVLWQALSDGATREGLAEELITAYGIDRERALADVDAYVAEMLEQGLLES